MKIAYVDIKNFRRISTAKIFFNGHSEIIGDNNAGKSTVFEAIDLVLGPDRLNRIPVVMNMIFITVSIIKKRDLHRKLKSKF